MKLLTTTDVYFTISGGGGLFVVYGAISGSEIKGRKGGVMLVGWLGIYWVLFAPASLELPPLQCMRGSKTTSCPQRVALSKDRFGPEIPFGHQVCLPEQMFGS